MTDILEQDAKHPLIRVRPDENVQAIGAQVAQLFIAGKERVTLRAIGAGAVNQAVKGTIQATQQLSAQGETLICKLGFKTVTGNDNKPVTAIVINCMLQ